MHKGDPVDVLLQVGQKACDPFATLASGHEGPWAPHEIPILTLETEKVFLAREWFPIAFFQFGLVLPEIHVRGGSRAKDLQHALCLGRKVRTGQQRCGARRFFSEQLGETESHHCRGDVAE